jgi:hypothetical protein
LTVGPVEGEWTTLVVGEPGGEEENIPFISHNVVLGRLGSALRALPLQRQPVGTQCLRERSIILRRMK